MHTYIESLCCIPKTNTMLYVNFISISKRIKKKETNLSYSRNLVLGL